MTTHFADPEMEGVTVPEPSMKDVYDVLLEVKSASGRIEGRLDGLEHRIVHLEQSFQRTAEDHNARLSSLEQWRAWTFGVAALAAALMGAVGSWIIAQLGGR